MRCVSTFLDALYIARRNAILGPALICFREHVAEFHDLQTIFITTGVRETISLPCQHGLSHFPLLIPSFGAPNGLCSSITELRHVKAVKRTWRRSSRFKAIVQMLHAILCLEKLANLHCTFKKAGMLAGSTPDYI